MHSYLLILTIFSICSFSNAASKAEDKTDFYVAIKGGISLGSYESGLNWAFLNYIHNDDQNNNLVSFSGASAGSINSLLSAIEHCQRSTFNTPVDNLFYKTWDVELSKLLKRGNAKDALFSRDTLVDKIKMIELQLSKLASRKCSITITMSITRFHPYKVKINGTGHDITLQRFVVPLKVSADYKGDRIKFTNVYNSIRKSKEFDTVPSVYIHLPEESDGTISFKRIQELALASSAFPVAFSPKEIEHCLSTTTRKDTPCVGDERVVKNIKFSDGGLFDNSPIGVALDIKNRKLVFSERKENKNKSIIFYINPDNYRKRIYSKKINIEKSASLPKEKGGTGLIEYGAYFYKSFANATSFELQKALLELEQPNSKGVKLITSNRFHHLMADFHAHFGAFYSSDFRQHDYIVGVYDGFSNVATFMCKDGSFTSNCRKTYIQKNIDSSFKNNDQNNKVYKEFITYLYHDEYGIDNKDYYKNNLVAINKAFSITTGYSSKEKTKSVHMPTYLHNLFKLRNDKEKYRNAPFSKETISIINHYDQWQSKQIKYALANISTMQSCGDDCAKANKSIGEFLETSEPIIDSILVHMDKRVWPLSIDILEEPSTTFSINLGYDVSEPSRVLGIKARFPISRIGFSIDAEINHHRLTSERENDDYYSASIGAVFHRGGGSSLLMPTWGIGIEKSDSSNIYKHKDTSIYLTAGFLSEIINLKWSHRLDDVDEYQNQQIRSQNQFLISLELGKIMQIIF